MPRIVSIVYTPRDVERRPTDHYARVPLDRATLVAGKGIAGDLKAGGGARQLNVMRAEALAELAAEGRKTGPGQMGEQLVIAGLDPADFAEGTRLRLGAEAVIEIGIPRTGCARFEYIQGTTKQTVAGRLGVLARVVAGGEVALGDEVMVVGPAP
jgi:MOSC domain-containing protein YiiM